MHCSICKREFPSGYSRCPDCLGWLRAKNKPEPVSLEWSSHGLPDTLEDAPTVEYSSRPSNKQEMLLAVLSPRTVPVDLGTRPRVVQRGLYAVLSCLILSVMLFAAYVYWEKSKLGNGPVLSQTRQSDLGALAEQNLRQGQAAYQRKEWAKAQHFGESAFDLLGSLAHAPPARVLQVRQFHYRATTRYAQAELALARQEMKAGQTARALADCRLAQSLYGRLSDAAKQQAQAYALEGKIQRGSGDLLAAQSCLEKAHELDPKGNYKSLIKDLPRPAPAPVLPVADSPQVTLVPSLGSGQAYPSGHKAAYRPVQAAPVVPVAVALAKKRPTSTYVPAKKKPRNLHADELPSYNDGK